jgi:hypothetical protein
MCSALLTMEHLLVTCCALIKTHLQFFNELSFPSVLSNVAPKQIIALMKAIGFHRKV